MSLQGPVASTEAIKKRWDSFADSYGDLLAPYLTPTGLALILNLRIDETVKNVLEVGCGTGTVTELCFQHIQNYRKFDGQEQNKIRLVATDLSDSMITKTQQRIARLLSKTNEQVILEASTANAEALPFKDGEFDRLYSNLCLMLVANHNNMLKETRRVLKPGGTAAFSVWGKQVDSNFMTMPRNIYAKKFPDLVVEERSNFHLNDLEKLKREAIEAGFTKCFAWFTPVSMNIRDGQEFVDVYSQLFPFQQQLSAITAKHGEQAKEEFLKEFRELADEEIVKKGEPVLFDHGVLIAIA